MVVDEFPERTAHAVRSAVLQTSPPRRVVVHARPGSLTGELKEQLRTLARDASIPLELTETQEPLTADLTRALADRADGAPADQQWIWLLRSDSHADPSALDQLLRTVETSPSVTVAGCTVVDAEHPRHLVSVGTTVTASAQPITLLEPGELDQGQHDARSDVLAVPLPGMLVRQDVWAMLDGLDPHTPERAAATDLCWRSRLAGHRVVVVPGARIHQQPADTDPDESRTRRRAEAELREAAVWLRLKHAPALAVPVLWLWSLITAVGAFLGSLLAKEPEVGTARLTGTLRTLLRPLALARSRRRARASRTVSRSVVGPLKATRREVRAHRRGLLDLDSPEEVIGDGTGSTTDEHQPTGDHDDFTALATPERNWVGLGLVVALVLLGGLSLVGWWGLLGAETATGGALLPLSEQASVLWHHAVNGWSTAGLGGPGQAGPFGLLMAVAGSTGHGSAVLLWLILMAMPLAAAGAWALAGSVARSRGGRLLMALLWGCSPALLVATGQGRIGAVLVHVLLPWLGVAVLRAVGAAAQHRLDPEGTPVDRRPRPGHRGVISWTASGWTALLLAVLTAAAPVLLPVLLAGLLLVAMITRSRGRTLWWTPLPTLALWLPALWVHHSTPRALLADPGVPLAADPAPVWQQLLGFPLALTPEADLAALPWAGGLDPNLPWTLIAALVIGVPVLLLAGLGLFSPGRPGRVARTGAVITVLGLLGAWSAPLLVTSLDAAGQTVTAGIAAFTSVVLLGLLLAAQAGVHTLREAGTVARVVVGVLAGLAVVSVALTSTLWLSPRLAGTAPAAGATQGTHEDFGFSTVVRGERQRTVPATAADQGLSPLSTRTLVLERTEEGLAVSLVSGSGTTLDHLSGAVTTRTLTGPLTAPRQARPDPADEALRSLAVQLTSGSAEDPRPALESFGAAFVVLRDPEGGEASTAAAIDAVPGLSSVGLTDSGWLWRATPAQDGGPEAAGVLGVEDRQGFFTSRARVEDAEGQVQLLLAQAEGRVQSTVPAADAPRSVVLAERADPGWRATLDGRPLTALPATGEGTSESAWAQRFELPATGGELTVWYESGVPAWLWWVAALLVGFAALLAIPTPARRGRAPLTSRASVQGSGPGVEPDAAVGTVDPDHDQDAEEVR